jgi:hypothetical protein
MHRNGIVMRYIDINNVQKSYNMQLRYANIWTQSRLTINKTIF